MLTFCVLEPSKWKKKELCSLAFPYLLIPGPTSPNVSSDCSALDLFERFFTPEVWDLLVVETSRYAAENVGGSTDTTVVEMKAFIGMIILMGVLKLPRLELYWSLKWPEIETPGMSSVMPIRRFEQFRFFHLNDNAHQISAGQAGHDIKLGHF